MKNQVEFEVGEDGVIRTMYQDGIEAFAKEVGGEITTSCRASDVEWEDDGKEKGWTVRSAHDKELAIRKTPEPEGWFGLAKEGSIFFFQTREAALEAEQLYFWELLAPKRANTNVE